MDKKPVYLTKTGAAGNGGVRHKSKEKWHEKKKRSVGVGRLPSRVEVEHQIVAWINDLRSDEISTRVTTSVIKHKAVELHPMFFGPVPPPYDLQEVFDISDNDGTGVVKEGDDDDGVEEVGSGVEPGHGDGSNEEAGGGAGGGPGGEAGEPPADDFT